MKADVVFTVSGWVPVFHEVFDVAEQTEQAVIDAIRQVIGKQRKINVVFINFCVEN